MNITPFHETIVISGTGNVAAEAALTRVRDKGFLTHCSTRLSAEGGTFGTTVTEVNRIAVGSGVVDDDRYYESGSPAGTATALTLSTTAADIRDTFGQPIPVDTGTGAPPFVRVVPAGTTGTWSVSVTVWGWNS